MALVVSAVEKCLMTLVNPLESFQMIKLVTVTELKT